MANNYMQSSTFVKIPKHKLAKAERILERIDKELQDSKDGYVGYNAELESDGAWIYSEEYLNANQAEKLMRALVDELNLKGIHICSWSYTCSKPRIGEFGGGAFAVQKGRDTVWIDAASEVLRLAELNEEVK